MNVRLTEQLYTEFPYLYCGHVKPKSESSMHWGFECGDGWFSLLQELSKDLSYYLAKKPDLNLEVTQVKSKFGILRYHVRGGDLETKRIIASTCQRASSICELTGNSIRTHEL
ncbi:hypothetical protein GCM10009425_38250 [Pseudomonas asuensis]|uniref:Uncharacterized protein n=1 Tax=Pseudomonas asuensis TaxID=1825787 RepID=A0ABQ2H1T1_9PSED|nr:hypothetical protein GCM10009425_38250 [Pseudomonas asuensis]